ncbi:MAG: bifunctional oligoribonuclease/PAP phosphatase NrnA [Gemmatimonadales bacterium]|nr:MAG: bifunctional oligoribonuclease/PAP phosphatase NrnA [Gemmatimonadales bacterium]
MRNPIPQHRASEIQAVLHALDGAERVVLTTHLNADGDGTGCQAALVSLLRDRGCEVRIINPTPFPDLFRFLLPDPDPVLEVTDPEAATWCEAADLCVVVDTAEVGRIGRVKPMVDPLPKVVIDHHPEGDNPIEGLYLRDIGAAAAGELVLDLVRTVDGPWNRSVVEGLYVALLTDTGSFRFSNTTPGAHRAAAELVERGADPDPLYRQVYGSVPLRRYQLLERTLPTLRQSDDGRVAWMTVSLGAFQELGCDASDLEGLTDYPRGLEGVEVAILFRELERGVKLSFRSNGGVDVNALAREFDGGGHVRAAGALVQGSLEEVRIRVLERVAQGVGEETGEGDDGTHAQSERDAAGSGAGRER